MTNPRHMRQLIVRRRRRLPPAPPQLDGVYFADPESPTGETFITFEQLKAGAEELMDPRLAQLVARDFGKIPYQVDPTYNMRKKK
jgi:hypothetical protein